MIIFKECHSHYSTQSNKIHVQITHITKNEPCMCNRLNSLTLNIGNSEIWLNLGHIWVNFDQNGSFLNFRQKIVSTPKTRLQAKN